MCWGIAADDTPRVQLRLHGSELDPEDSLRRAGPFSIGVPGLARTHRAERDGDSWLVTYPCNAQRALLELEAPELSQLSPSVEAVATLHDQGMAFGMIWPELIWPAERGALMGLGVAGALSRLPPSPYLAPEQHPTGKPTLAGDVWSVGQVACHVLYGAAVASADDLPAGAPAALKQALHVEAAERVQDLRTWWSQLLAEVEAIETTNEEPTPASAPAPASEPPPAPAFRAPSVPPALPQEESTAPAPAPAPSPPPAPPPSLPRGPDKKPPGNALTVIALTLGGLLVVGGLGVVITLLMLRPSPSSTTVATAPAPASPPPPVVVPPAKPAPAPWTGSGGAGGGSATGTGAPTNAPPLAAVGPRTGTNHAAHTTALLPIDDLTALWGERDAWATVLVFGDLECPHTRATFRELALLRRSKGEDVRVAFRFRLQRYPNSKASAKVALGLLRDKGHDAFWRFFELVAGSTEEGDTGQLEKWVDAVIGDGDGARRVMRWLADPVLERRLQADQALTTRLRVRETPWFYINGQNYVGKQKHRDLLRFTNAEISASRGLLALGVARPDIYANRVRKNHIGVGPNTIYRNCVPIGSSPVRGKRDALVTIVEFSDFQCGYCAQAQATLKTLLSRYGADLRLVWKNLPLDFHPRAREAASFALEARSLGGEKAFWSAHDALFATHDDLGDDALNDIATKLGLSPKALLDAATGRKHKRQVEADLALADTIGAKGTPMFYINGRLLSGAKPVGDFRTIIDEELKFTKGLEADGTARAKMYDTVCGY